MIVRPLTNVSLYRIDHLQCRCVFVLELGDAGHRALTRTGAWHLSALDVVFQRQHRSSRMAKGTVKWFNATKGTDLSNRQVGVVGTFSFTSRPLKRRA
jgi:hypothetical protein